ncbi:MAG: hypothetical protein PHC33_05010 [Candidatus Omnitrophica bacterium]|nr:hypothetical protein [Candidatus Omnitrophota bacterium]
MRRNKKKKRLPYLPVILIAGILIGTAGYSAVRFSSPSMLKAYIAAGTGSCQTSPIFCMAPDREITIAHIDKEYLAELALFRFKGLEICMPKDFTVVHEREHKVFYKKWKRKTKSSTAFILIQSPDYFINLFPQVGERGIKNDYEFLERTMSANLNAIKNATDAFFVIVKGIFIPDIGNQKTAIMARFAMGKWKGFINYNLTPGLNYFDCSIITEQGRFYKVYIKDMGAKLNTDKVFSIISTIKIK